MSPFTLLPVLFGDPEMDVLFSEEATVQAWLDAERALAAAQEELGILTAAERDGVTAAAAVATIDFERLWRDARNVGYPILPLVHQLTEAAGEGAGRVHYGATTQDVLDTGIALQLRAALDRLDELLGRATAELARHVEAERGTVIAGRTHAQQAVPTTLGAKLAVFLAELLRHRERLCEGRARIVRVSLYGAAGTSAALGPQSAAVRDRLAALLDLPADPVPWHVARDAIAEYCGLCGLIASTCARLAREVIDLARTEIGEISEGTGHHHGASSTMPQKSNPVISEAIVGMAAVAQALVPASLRAMESGHERAAGALQIEWYAVPSITCLAAGCLLRAGELAERMTFDRAAMRLNLDRDQGLIMAEAYMIRLAEPLGRGAAHDLVYAAARRAREEQRPLDELLAELAPDGAHRRLDPSDYLGEALAICDAALDRHRAGG
jgi:3-carboxy-cis,cis-muconate cycloisomerase